MEEFNLIIDILGMFTTEKQIICLILAMPNKNTGAHAATYDRVVLVMILRFLILASKNGVPFYGSPGQCLVSN